MCAGLDLGMEALDFIVEIVGDGIHGHTDRKIRRATESFPRPVRALIQATQNFHEADGIDFVDALVSDSRRRTAVAGDRKNVADAPTVHAPSSAACRPMMFWSRVVRCGTVSTPRASRAPAVIRASMPTRAIAPLLMSMASTFFEAMTLSTCS